MAKTYKEATVVVALDSELLGTSCLVPEEIIALRIRYSGWMRRLWTLQEAILPERECLIQFCDGTIPLFEFTKKLSEIIYNFRWSGELPSNTRTFHVVLGHWRTFETSWKSNPMRREEIFVQSDYLRRNRHTPYRDVGKLRWNREYPGQKLRSTWNAIVGRRTSKAEDEPTIFACLLYLEAGVHLSGLPLAERWKVVFSRLGYPYQIPQDIVFHSGPRPDQDGWRWITLSITETSSKLFSSRFGQVSRSAWKGLGVDFDGIHLDLSKGTIDLDFLRAQPEPFHLWDKRNDTWYLCKCQVSTLVKLADQDEPDSSTATTEQDTVSDKGATPPAVSIILHHREQFVRPMGQSDNLNRATVDMDLAILVELLDPETRHSRYICNVQIDAINPTSAPVLQDLVRVENRSFGAEGCATDPGDLRWTVISFTEKEEHWVVG